MIRIPTLLAALLLGTPVMTTAAHAQAVVATDAWARATPPGAATAAAYLTLTSPLADTLTGVTTPAAGMAEVHEMAMEGNVMQMRELPSGLPLPANQAVTLKPGGFHIMLMNLRAPLKPGDTLPLHLTFAHAPAQDVVATVAAIGATTAPHAH